MVIAFGILLANLVILMSARIDILYTKPVRLGVEACLFSLVLALFFEALIVLVLPFTTGSLDRMSSAFVLAFVVYLIVTAIKHYLVIARPYSDATASSSAILERLPNALGRNIIHVSSRDHHVEMQTTKGVHKVRMRFSDALKELADLEGIQVHRSHWVARREIKTVEMHDGKTVLVLKNGANVPVSRTFRNQKELAKFF